MAIEPGEARTAMTPEQNDPHTQQGADSVSETERAVSSDRFCEGCGAPLDGRRPKARFCANRCRTSHGRRGRARRVLTLVDQLERILMQLKTELGGEP